MNKNLYTQAVDSIKAPEELRQKVLSAAQNEEKKEKILPMNKITKSLIAASIALALILGGVFGAHLLSPKNDPFTLTVNAAEITETGYTDIGTLDSIGGSLTTGENSSRVVMTELFCFNVKVEGEDVENVSYSITGGDFGSVEPMRVQGEDGEEYSIDTLIRQSDIVSPEEDEKNFTRVWIRADSYDSTLPDEARQALLDWNNHANFKLDLPIDDDYDDSAFDIADCKQTLFDALLDRLKIKVHITYLDGAKEERAIVFSCSVDENGRASILAKMA